MKDIKPTICFSAEEACNQLEREVPSDLPSQQYKSLREAWFAAKMLRYMSLDTARYSICLHDKEADSVDINIIDCNQPSVKYRIQVTEIAPKSLNSRTLFNPVAKQGYVDLKKETYDLILKAIKRKEKRYSKPDKENLNLLIYFNPPLLIDDTATPFYKTIYLDHGIDLDIKKITKTIADSDFASVVLISSGALSFLKGKGLVAAETQFA